MVEATLNNLVMWILTAFLLGDAVNDLVDENPRIIIMFTASMFLLVVILHAILQKSKS